MGRKNKVKFSNLKTVGVGFSDISQEDITTPILLTRQAPSFRKTVQHGAAEPGG